MTTLELPPEIESDNKRMEVLRAWIDEGKLSLAYCSEQSWLYEDNPKSTWAMYLSDIVHHAAHAIYLETERSESISRQAILSHLKEIMDSGRDFRKGDIYTQRELPGQRLPLERRTDDLQEMACILHSEGTIHVLLNVGCWLEIGEEEANWANIVYDLAGMLSEQFPNVEETVNEILELLVKFIEHPTTDSYTGAY